MFQDAKLSTMATPPPVSHKGGISAAVLTSDSVEARQKAAGGFARRYFLPDQGPDDQRAHRG